MRPMSNAYGLNGRLFLHPKKEVYTMIKLPWSKWVWSDWFRDTGKLSAESKGAWIDIIGYSWNEPERGIYTRSRDQFCRELRIPQEHLLDVLSELMTVAS